MANFDRIRKEQEKNLEAAHQVRIERCVKTARKILAALATEIETVPMGDVKQDHPGYDSLTKKFLAVMLEDNIHWVDRDFVFQLALQALSFPANIAQDSLNHSWNNAITGLFGKPVRELLASEVDAALKKGDAIEEASEQVS